MFKLYTKEVAPENKPTSYYQWMEQWCTPTPQVAEINKLLQLMAEQQHLYVNQDKVR